MQTDEEESIPEETLSRERERGGGDSKKRDEKRKERTIYCEMKKSVN